MDGAVIYEAINYPKSALNYDHRNDTYTFTCGLFPIKYSIIYCVNRENQIYNINFTYNDVHYEKGELIKKINADLFEHLKI